MGVELATSVSTGPDITLRQANAAQTADVSRDTAIERLRNSLAIGGLLQLARVIGIGQERNLSQDRRHVGADQDHERSLLDPAITQSRIPVFEIAVE